MLASGCGQSKHRLLPLPRCRFAGGIHEGIIVATAGWTTCSAAFRVAMSFYILFHDVDQMVFFDPS
jgi:hypothetical protein